MSLNIKNEEVHAAAISAATLVEASVVADGSRRPLRSSRSDDFIDALAPEVVPLTAAQAAIARQAYRDFGRGSGHPARLNLGDCFSYAVASDRGQPLLYAGEDYVQTDIASALWPVGHSDVPRHHTVGLTGFEPATP